MRTLHRWFGLITSIFLIIISLTGVGMQLIDLTGNGDHHGPPGGPRSQATALSIAQPGGGPDGEASGLNLRQLFNHIHTGEYFGSVGIYISLLSGLALFFFSVSGLYLYWQMFKSRAAIGKKQIFW